MPDPFAIASPAAAPADLDSPARPPADDTVVDAADVDPAGPTRTAAPRPPRRGDETVPSGRSSTRRPVDPDKPARLSESAIQSMLRRGRSFTLKARKAEAEATAAVDLRTDVYDRLRRAGVPADRIAAEWGLSRQILDRQRKERRADSTDV